MKKKMIEILEDVRWWDTCPNDWKKEIFDFLASENEKPALNLACVSKQREPFISLIKWLKNHKHSEKLYKETPECIVKYYFKEINGY